MTEDERRAVEIRDRALALANNSGDLPEKVVERAKIYETYLRGDTGSKDVLEPGDDGYPDALHG